MLQPYFINSALENAKLKEIKEASELALIESKSYPDFLDVMAILFVLNILIMLVIGKLKPQKTVYKQTYTNLDSMF